MPHTSQRIEPPEYCLDEPLFVEYCFRISVPVSIRHLIFILSAVRYSDGGFLLWPLQPVHAICNCILRCRRELVPWWCLQPPTATLGPGIFITSDLRASTKPNPSVPYNVTHPNVQFFGYAPLANSSDVWPKSTYQTGLIAIWEVSLIRLSALSCDQTNVCAKHEENPPHFRPLVRNDSDW